MKLIFTNHFRKNLIDRGFTWDFKILFNEALRIWTKKERPDWVTKLIYKYDRIYYKEEWESIIFITYAKKQNGSKFKKLLYALINIDKEVTENIDEKFVIAFAEYKWRLYKRNKVRENNLLVKRLDVVNHIIWWWKSVWEEFIRKEIDLILNR